MLEELYREDHAVDGGVEEIADEVQLRKLMIVVAQLEREHRQTVERKTAVVATYDRDIDNLTERIDGLKRAIESYVKQHGKVRFPDVGTAYLSNRKPKVVIADADLVRATYGDLFTKSVFDEVDFRAWAAAKIEETGEIPVGVDLVPGEKKLAIRKA